MIGSRASSCDTPLPPSFTFVKDSTVHEWSTDVEGWGRDPAFSNTSAYWSSPGQFWAGVPAGGTSVLYGPSNAYPSPVTAGTTVQTSAFVHSSTLGLNRLRLGVEEWNRDGSGTSGDVIMQPEYESTDLVAGVWKLCTWQATKVDWAYFRRWVIRIDSRLGTSNITARFESLDIGDPGWRGLTDWWVARYDDKYQTSSDWYRGQIAAADSWKMYGSAYGIDAANCMYRATDDVNHLDVALAYAEQAIGTAVVSSSLPSSQYQDSFLGWPNVTHYDPPNTAIEGNEYPLFESYFWRYVTRTLRLIKDDATAPAGLVSRAATVLAFTETNMWDKWYTRGTANLYRSNAHMASHWASIAHDVAYLTADSARKTNCETVRNTIDYGSIPGYGTSLRGQLVTVGSAYEWVADFTGVSTDPQDVGHGNAVISYMVHSYQTGGYWTLADLQKMVETWRVCWPATGPQPFYVDGTGTGGGYFSDGFVKLGRFAADLHDRMSDGYPVSLQYYATAAMNARFLIA